MLEANAGDRTSRDPSGAVRRVYLRGGSPRSQRHGSGYVQRNLDIRREPARILTHKKGDGGCSGPYTSCSRAGHHCQHGEGHLAKPLEVRARLPCVWRNGVTSCTTGDPETHNRLLKKGKSFNQGGRILLVQESKPL